MESQYKELETSGNGGLPAESLVSIANGKALTHSRIVAKKFGRTHKDILQAIDNLLDQMSRLRAPPAVNSTGAKGPSVSLMEKRAANNDRYFEMDRDAFTLLAVGFTGEKALQWKLEYIHAFNAIESTLKAAAFSASGHPQHPQLAEAVPRASAPAAHFPQWASPLHVEPIFGTALRYFESPDRKGLPWTSAADLAELLELPDPVPAKLLQLSQSTHQDASHCATVPTPQGTIIIISHPLACQILEVFSANPVSGDKTGKDILTAYERGGAAAIGALYAHLPPPARFAALIAAHRHTLAAARGEPPLQSAGRLQ